MIRAGIALLAAGSGTVAQWLAQAAAAPSSSEVSAWVSAGGTSLAVGGLVYIARLLASGHLVAYPVEKLQEDAASREKDLSDHLKRSHERERALERILMGRHGIGPDDA